MIALFKFPIYLLSLFSSSTYGKGFPGTDVGSGHAYLVGVYLVLPPFFASSSFFESFACLDARARQHGADRFHTWNGRAQADRQEGHTVEWGRFQVRKGFPSVVGSFWLHIK